MMKSDTGNPNVPLASRESERERENSGMSLSFITLPADQHTPWNANKPPQTQTTPVSHARIQVGESRIGPNQICGPSQDVGAARLETGSRKKRQK
mmetsp:Transcript_5041/g.10421  ORF Transcript_5041/g.10421 Transcript_5041/m.10421 type:complete len:95 (-) Transcript_5041:414-698(-)